MILHHILESLVSPFFLSIFLLLIGTFCLWFRNDWILGKILASLSLGILLLISTGWLPKFLNVQLESQYPIITEADQKVEWIVVLGGGRYQIKGVPANDTLTPGSINRLVEGIRLSKLLPKARMILSGGAAGGNLKESEAKGLANLAKLLGIPEQKIMLEDRSRNTEEQARQIAPLVKDNAFYLVTSAAHMPRSMIIFKHYGLHPIASPTDFTYFSNQSRDRIIIPNTYNMVKVSNALHELLGMAWFKNNH